MRASDKGIAMTSDFDLAAAVKRQAMLNGRFTLRSGQVSDTYFDKYLFESDPTILKRIAEGLAGLISEDTKILAGLEMGGIPVVTMLSQLTGIPAAFIRKEAKEYGTCKYAEGPELRGKTVTLVEDVVSSGGAILDAVSKLREDHVEPAGCVCVIDRQSGGLENLQAAGIELKSLFTMQDIVESS